MVPPNVDSIKNTFKTFDDSEIARMFEERLNILIITDEDLLISENFGRVWVSSDTEEENKYIGAEETAEIPKDFLGFVCLLQQDKVCNQDRYSWFKLQIHLKLLKRRQGRHLNIEEKIYIMDLTKEYPEDEEIIRWHYKLSQSTMKRIQQEHPAIRDRGTGYALPADEFKINCEMLSEVIHKIVIPP